MRRRAFLGAMLASVTAAARAQSAPRLRKVGVVMNYAESDPEGQARFSALKSTLQTLGWVRDRDIQIDVRWAAGRADLMRSSLAELAAAPVEVLVVNSTPLLSAATQSVHDIPIIFSQVADPIGSGFVTNYSRPGGNITGLTDYDATIGGKWVEILKEAVPGIRCAAVLFDPEQRNHRAFLKAIEGSASALGLKITEMAVSDRSGVERALASLSGMVDCGLIVLPGPVNNTQRDAIIPPVNRLRLPAIYPFKYYAKEGGLLYYGADQRAQWIKVAEYVDRVLKGEKPGDLPVQGPTTFELVVNIKTARGIGLNLPPTLLARADEVVE